MTTDKAQMFLTRWRQLSRWMTEPIAEYRFHPTRKWRFDFAWPERMVAVEVDGGQWLQFGGRHGRDSDREKLNAAAMFGWRVLRYSPQMIENDPSRVIAEVEAALALGL